MFSCLILSSGNVLMRYYFIYFCVKKGKKPRRKYIFGFIILEKQNIHFASLHALACFSFFISFVFFCIFSIFYCNWTVWSILDFFSVYLFVIFWNRLKQFYYGCCFLHFGNSNRKVLAFYGWRREEQQIRAYACPNHK